MTIRHSLIAFAAALAACALAAPALAQDEEEAPDAEQAVREFVMPVEYVWRQTCSISEEDVAAREDACANLIASKDRAWRRSGHVARGHLRFSERRFEEAIADYTAAIGMDPEASEAYQFRGASHTELKQFAEARKDIMAAVRMEPMNPSFHNSLCWTLALEAVDLDRAISYCNIAIGLDPAFAPAIDSRAMAYLKADKFDLALADYERAYRTAPDSAHFMYGRGIALMRLGRAKEGQRWLDDALKADPGIAKTYADYGVTP